MADGRLSKINTEKVAMRVTREPVVIKVYSAGFSPPATAKGAGKGKAGSKTT